MIQEFYKKIYTHHEFYWAIFEAVRSFKYFSAARRKKLLSPKFIERIMLAVTEVNGCEVCSYAHTKMALEQGMSAKEIKEILSGETGNIPEDEAVAVMFSQHYADQRGKPSAESWQRLVDQYGEASAQGILAAVRIMTMANIYGIAFSAMRSRLKGKPVSKTSLLYEVSIILAIFIYLPIGVIHAVLANLKNEPLLKF
ncbi:MAG: carboxymuconolactone decarboxylase family protein [Sedimentibacter sp.]